MSASSWRRGSSHEAWVPGSSPRLAMFSGTCASAQAARASPDSSARWARHTSLAAASTSTQAGSGSDRPSSSRPKTMSRPSAERRRDSSVRIAASCDRGAVSGHSAPISSSRPTGRSRLSTR